MIQIVLTISIKMPKIVNRYVSLLYTGIKISIKTVRLRLFSTNPGLVENKPKTYK